MALTPFRPPQVDMGEARKLSQQQRSVASGLKDSAGPGNMAVADVPQVLRRMYNPLKGPELCHSDVVKCIVVTETGKIMTGGCVAAYYWTSFFLAH